MNRRQALTAMAGGVASFFLLSVEKRRRHIDLSAFCGEDSRRFSLSKPFWQDGKVFATDGRVCLRVGEHSGDVLGPECKLPPAATLPWGERGAKVTRARYVMAMEYCPTCEGHGYANLKKCPVCGGADDPWCTNMKCMEGMVGEGTCATCNGRGEFVQPCLVEATAEGEVQYFARVLWDKVQSVGDVQVRLKHGKYKNVFGTVDHPAFVEFDGGDGLLMPMDKVATKQRIAQTEGV